MFCKNKKHVKIIFTPERSLKLVVIICEFDCHLWPGVIDTTLCKVLSFSNDWSVIFSTNPSSHKQYYRSPLNKGNIVLKLG